MLALGLLATASVLLSGLPGWCRALLALAAAAHGFALARREWRRPARALELDDGSARLVTSGQAPVDLQAPRLRLRGVLASVQGRDAGGRRHELLWCGDTLDAAGRRKLRLHLGGLDPA